MCPEKKTERNNVVTLEFRGQRLAIWFLVPGLWFLVSSNLRNLGIKVWGWDSRLLVSVYWFARFGYPEITFFNTDPQITQINGESQKLTEPTTSNQKPNTMRNAEL
jgi:hypothetical protein